MPNLDYISALEIEEPSPKRVKVAETTMKNIETFLDHLESIKEVRIQPHPIPHPTHPMPQPTPPHAPTVALSTIYLRNW